MGNKTVWPLVQVFCLLLLAIFAGHLTKTAEATPAERTVGVKVGDWIKYGNFLALWESDDPTAKPWQGLLDVNQTEWVTNTVMEISGSNMTFQTVTHFRNDTETTSVHSVDVTTGPGNSSMMFISAGLSSGEILYENIEFIDSRINETVSRAYAGLTRKTNHLNVSFIDYSQFTNFSRVASFVSNHYWDKTTGILVERRITSVDYTVDFLTWATVSDRMIDNNIWIGVPDSIPPTAEAGADQTIDEGATASFDAGDSTDNTGIASFEWNFGDGETGTGMKTTHTYTEAETYTVTLTVRDAKGNSATDTLTVTMRRLPSSSPQLPAGIAAILVLAAISLILWFLFKRKF